MNKSILFKEIKELKKASDLLAENIRVVRFHPDVLRKECFKNEHSWAGSEGVLFYLLLKDGTIEKVPSGGWYSDNGVMTWYENHFLWEKFLTEEGDINENLINNVLCIFTYEWRDFNRDFEVPESTIFVRINKDLLLNEIEKIIQEEKEKILNPE